MPRRAEVDWIAVGLALLREHGHTRLTVADLCARARMTKGSLYHHYPDMSALRAALLMTWHEQHTEVLIAETEHPDCVAGKTRMLERLALGLDMSLERAVRNWAAHEAVARERVQAVDRQRIEYLSRLCHAEGGHSPADARDLATLTYATYLGLQHLLGDDKQADLHRLTPKVEFVLPQAVDSGVRPARPVARLRKGSRS